MAKGDHIKVKRKGYYHHGIDIGDGTVVHYTGEPTNMLNTSIKRTPLEDFLKGGKLEIVHQYSSFTPDEVVARALSGVGIDIGEYNLITNNCEHFANFCKTGEKTSKQVAQKTLERQREGIFRKSKRTAIAGIEILKTTGNILKNILKD